MSAATVVIQPARGLFDLDLKAVWEYRELLYFLVWRDDYYFRWPARPRARRGACLWLARVAPGRQDDALGLHGSIGFDRRGSCDAERAPECQAVPTGGHLHAKLRESNDMDPEVREMLHINEEQRRCEQANGAKESEINGTYDSSDWAIPLGFSRRRSRRRAEETWHEQGPGARAYDVDNVTSCLRVSFLLQRSRERGGGVMMPAPAPDDRARVQRALRGADRGLHGARPAARLSRAARALADLHDRRRRGSRQSRAVDSMAHGAFGHDVRRASASSISGMATSFARSRWRDCCRMPASRRRFGSMNVNYERLNGYFIPDPWHKVGRTTPAIAAALLRGDLATGAGIVARGWVLAARTWPGSGGS